MQKMPSMPNGRSRSAAAKIRRKENGGDASALAAILVVVSLIVFTLSVREGETGFFGGVRSVAQTITSPVRFAGAAIFAPLQGLGNVVRNLTADEKSLSELKEENERLTARNVELEEAQITAQRLQALLDLKSTHDLQSTAARVIAGSTDSWSSTVTIDKGTASGLAVGMPVTNEGGAVGQLIACAGTTSTVKLISDEGSSVSAMVQSSRAQGMLEGSIDGTLYLSFIRTDQTVNVGDIVVTSGLGGVFPKGLPMGKISSVERSPGATYYKIVVEPFTRPENLEEVLVITSLTEAQQADEEDIAQADAADLEAASGRLVSSEESADEPESDVEDGEAEDDGMQDEVWEEGNTSNADEGY